jgi:hypothetical protein
MLTKLDPDDPLGIRALLDEVRSDGLPVVDLLGSFRSDNEDAQPT